jgi:integrase
MGRKLATLSLIGLSLIIIVALVLVSVKQDVQPGDDVDLKKFVALMISKKNGQGKPLSAKRIRNVIIPLRMITKDAFTEYGWHTLPDPFVRLKLPRPTKFRVQPFGFDEWEKFIALMPDWYRPYFEFSVNTGLRPSEQVALKWQAIDDEFIHIELSRVRKEEKEDLKTQGSRRRFKIRPTLKAILAEQNSLTKHLDSPYVFVNESGQPLDQNRLRELWVRVIETSGLRFRRMYETRHTFASWALALGETPEWVARTLGHVDTSMVYKTYCRYIPNLTRDDGSALEQRFRGNSEKESMNLGHNRGHNPGNNAKNNQ